jgi:NAD(P)-dependent dehydrogenase (short-subunit alcohol dehydrogenase family)
MTAVATPSVPSDLAPAAATDLAGKTAVITGGTTGLGFAAARRFLAEGARVLVTGQDAGRVADAAALGPGATAVRADVRAVADLDALAAHAREHFGAPPEGGVDVVFANAGVGGFAPLEQADVPHRGGGTWRTTRSTSSRRSTT